MTADELAKVRADVQRTETQMLHSSSVVFLAAHCRTLLAEVERLTGERDALAAAIKPFAEYADFLEGMGVPDDRVIGFYFPPYLRAGDVRRAAELLATTEPTPKPEG